MYSKVPPLGTLHGQSLKAQPEKALHRQVRGCWHQHACFQRKKTTLNRDELWESQENVQVIIVSKLLAYGWLRREVWKYHDYPAHWFLTLTASKKKHVKQLRSPPPLQFEIFGLLAKFWLSWTRFSESHSIWLTERVWSSFKCTIYDLQPSPPRGMNCLLCNENLYFAVLKRSTIKSFLHCTKKNQRHMSEQIQALFFKVPNTKTNTKLTLTLKCLKNEP